jgi:DNA phosphorothioation-dependent restriction protein DptF
LLVGQGYLFDNLFTESENELSQKLAEFDPANLHTKALDQFALHYELELPDQELEEFLRDLAKVHIRFFDSLDRPQGCAASLIRLFNVMRNQSFGNDYHMRFRDEFREIVLEEYGRIWTLHHMYDGSKENRIALRQYYSAELIAAIHAYANRQAPELSHIKGEFYLGQFGTVKVMAPVELKGNFDAIKKNQSHRSENFTVCLKMHEMDLPPITISFNLFELMRRIIQGYRPNRYDKNSIVLLDEIVDSIASKARVGNRLKFYDGNTAYLLKSEDGMIDVSGAV